MRCSFSICTLSYYELVLILSFELKFERLATLSGSRTVRHGWTSRNVRGWLWRQLMHSFNLNSFTLLTAIRFLQGHVSSRSNSSALCQDISRIVLILLESIWLLTCLRCDRSKLYIRALWRLGISLSWRLILLSITWRECFQSFDRNRNR